MRILVVEDEATLAHALEKILQGAGYSVDIYATKSLAIEAIRGTEYLAVILDRCLPDGDGLSVITELKSVMKADKLPPFLVLSALGESAEKVEGLSGGAIDYMVKPYDPDELLERLRICISTKTGITSHKVELSNISYCLVQKTLSVDGKLVSLRRRERAIFDFLIRNRNSVVHRERIENSVYGAEKDYSSNAMSVHVSRLRKALEAAGAEITVQVMRNIGYTLAEK